MCWRWLELFTVYIKLKIHQYQCRCLSKVDISPVSWLIFITCSVRLYLWYKYHQYQYCGVIKLVDAPIFTNIVLALGYITAHNSLLLVLFYGFYIELYLTLWHLEFKDEMSVQYKIWKYILYTVKRKLKTNF